MARSWRTVDYLFIWHLKLHKIIRRIKKMDKKIVCAMFITVAVFCMADSSDAAGKARIPKTGEITSYGTGSDGFLQKGVAWPNPRFTDNLVGAVSNGTVTDNLTGLIWLKNASCFGYLNWAAALVSANSLASTTCGLSDGSVAGDWRLPSVQELSSMTDLSRSYPALPTGNLFTNVQPHTYWSSSTNASNTASAWDVDMVFGNVSNYDKSSSYYVWPVRGGQ
jgi:hypothetical protein